MAAGGLSKANSRKYSNKKRQARKAQSWANGQERKDKNRHPNDKVPGTACPPGPAQIPVPRILRGLMTQANANVLIRTDSKPVYERVKLV